MLSCGLMTALWTSVSERGGVPVVPDLLSSSTQGDNRGSSTWQPPLRFPLWGEQMEQRGHQHGGFIPCSSSLLAGTSS